MGFYIPVDWPQGRIGKAPAADPASPAGAAGPHRGVRSRHAAGGQATSPGRGQGAQDRDHPAAAVNGSNKVKAAGNRGFLVRRDGSQRGNSVSNALTIPSMQTSSRISPFSAEASLGEDKVPLAGVHSGIAG